MYHSMQSVILKNPPNEASDFIGRPNGNGNGEETSKFMNTSTLDIRPSLKNMSTISPAIGIASYTKLENIYLL